MSDDLRSSLRRAAGLLVVLAVAKGGLVAARLLEGWGRDLLSPWTVAAMLDQAVWLALTVGMVDAAVVRASRGRVDRALWVLYALVVAWTAINFPVARLLSTPLTVELLEGAGGALIDSILLYATAANIAALVLIVAAAVLAPRLLPGRLARRAAIALAVAGVGVLALGPLARRRVETLGLHRDPVLCLAASAWRRLHRPSAPSTLPALAPEGEAAAETPGLSARAGAARGRSVLWVSLESTAAQYLGLHGATPDPTPNLTRLAASPGALVFEAAYSPYPGSMKALYSMLCAMYPAPFTATDHYRHAPCASLAAALAAAGYRTGIFHAGRFDYLGMSHVVDPHRFHLASDASSIAARQTVAFGIDEPSVVARLLAFVDELDRARPGQPFFALYLPIAGHHPYRWPGAPRPFGDDTMFDRYLNDLHRGDQALGQLLDGLRARGRLERMLLVVSGDHGEAFGQHPGNQAHPMFVFDENVRVPLVMVAPGLAATGARLRRPASLVDVGPTILALLGQPAPREADGRSLLGPPGVARFFTDFGLPQVGLRDGRWKLILDLEGDRARLHDATEPGERRDHASQQPERVARYRAHLEAWWQQQRTR